MIKIGDFAKMFDVSTKTVRHYEKVGLLVPYEVDIYSGYRYFNEDNVKRMEEILSLKELGFSLEEIKKFSDEEIKLKIKDYENKILDMKSKILSLKRLSFNGKGVLKVNFINDENAIGKWELIGVATTMENAKNNLFVEDDYRINELYLMPGGKKYWIISWTKGIVKFKDKENQYKIINDKMFLTINSNYDEEESKVAVYKKIDNKEYSEEEIRIEDSLDVEFIEDKNLIGFWKAVDYVNNPNSFNPNKKQYRDNLYLTDICISPDNNVIISYLKDNCAKKTSYTKGCIFNVVMNKTACNYEIKKILGKTYLIVEWKSGDYVYGKFISGYYVLEKQQ